MNDGDEDFDEDGLTNLEEFENKTNPYIDDTDGDGLLDGDEVKTHGTDPLVEDTDGDDLDDGDEIILGTNPLVEDTDGNGVIGSQEKFQQTFTHKVKNGDCAVTEVIVDMECTGNINRTTSVESVMNVDILCTDVVGLVGEPFEIETMSEFDKATLTFKIDKDKLGEIPFDNLLFLWYNEEEDEFIELETTLNEENGTASIVTTHFSKYMIVDKKAWFEAWAKEFNYNPASDPGIPSGAPTIRYNTVLAIDCSGSMDWNDPRSQRAEAAEKFIEHMNRDDKIAIVFFTGSAQLVAPMSNDGSVLKNTLKRIYSSGGTNFSNAINKAISAFDEKDINASYVNNRIILLSDGEDGGSRSALNDTLEEWDEKNKNIKIFTVGFGSASDSLMRDIAEATGGEYYKAFSADDLVDIFAEIGYSSDFDMTDTDGDELPDAVETAGIRLQNGKIIYLDPTDYDCDQDGLWDGEEINPKPIYSTKEDNGLLGIKKLLGINTVKGYYFKMTSNPMKVDSDGDGHADGPIDALGNGKFNDPRRMKCDVFSYKLSKSDTYVNVNGNYGGYQSWIKGKAYPNSDIYSAGGCAIAAACDFMIYLERTDPKYAGLTGLPDINNITEDQYVDYFYHIGSNYVKPIDFSETKEALEEIIVSDKNSLAYTSAIKLYAILTIATKAKYTWGVLPWDYCKYVNDACNSINVQHIDLTGLSLADDAMFTFELWRDIISLEFDRTHISQYIEPALQNQMIENIKNSLSNDCPVTLCYGLKSEYTFYEDTKFTLPYNNKEIRSAPHFVNMTEYIIDTIADEEYITIASWGNRLYIDPEQIFQGHGIGGALLFYAT